MQIYWNAKKMFALEKSSTPTGLVWSTNITTVSLFWDTNMAAVTSCENPLLRVILFSLFGMSQLQECITGLEVDHNLTICLLIQRKNVLKPCRGMQCYLFPEAATRNNIKIANFAIRQQDIFKLFPEKGFALSKYSPAVTIHYSLATACNS